MAEMTKSEMVRAYEDWLSLLDHLHGRFAVEWPNGDLHPRTNYDEIIVFWKLGQVGRIYRDKNRCVWSSSVRTQLREIDPDEDEYRIHEQGFDFVGWSVNERLRSEIEYSLKHFWQTAFEEAQVAWNAVVLANDALEE